MGGLQGPDPDGTRFVALTKPIHDLRLSLAPADGRHPSLRLFENCMLKIDGAEARLRY